MLGKHNKIVSGVLVLLMVFSLAMPAFSFFGTQNVLADEVASDIIGATRAQALGYDGTGILIGDVGTGLDVGDNATVFTDFAGRVQYWTDWTEADTSDGIAEDGFGMSTPFYSWMAGDGSSGQTDPGDGTLYGLGAAPGADIIVERVFGDAGGWFGGSISDVFQDAGQAGTFALGNSWGGGNNGEYDGMSNQIDTASRDADTTTPGDQPVLMFVAAGEGNLMATACNKNGLSMGSSENYKPFKSSNADNIEEWITTTSQGPTADGRIKPDLVVPASWVAGVRSHDPGAIITGNEVINADYMYISGTGGAAGLATGASAVFAEYYNGIQGSVPSPAMAKAALINGATDMNDAFNTGPIPNNQEGWGRLNLTNVIDPAFNVFYDDQAVFLEDNINQTYSDIFVVDDTQPFKISLVWTDVPAPGTTGTGRTLINDLDLIVYSPGGTRYDGNMFLNGWSDPLTPGPDTANNVENVYVQTPELGQWTIIVNGTDITQDAVASTGAVDQDYALVVSGLFEIGGGPVVTDAYTDPNPTNGAALSTLYADLSDTDNVFGAEFFIDSTGPNGTGIAMLPMDAGFDSPDESAYSVLDIGALGWLPGEEHTLFVHGLDDVSDWGGFYEVTIYVGTGYYLHVENSIGTDMSLLTTNPDQPSVIGNTTGDMNVPGQYQVGTQAWITDPYAVDTDIGGTWRFFMNGYVTTFEATGNLYAKVYEHSTMTLLNPAPTQCPDDISGKFVDYEFEWSDVIPASTISSGDRLYVEIWLDNPTGGGFSGAMTYNYSGAIEGAGPHYGYFCDVNSISAPGGPSLDSFAEFTTIEYGQVTGSDDIRAASVDPGPQDEIFIWNYMDIAENPAIITQIDLTFEGQGDAATDFQIWIQNNLNEWAQVGTAVSASADTDVTITRSIVANCADYTGGGLTWGVYQTDNNDLIRVDHLEAVISYYQAPPQFIMGYDNDSAPSMIIVPEVNAGPPATWDIPIPGGAVAGDWLLLSFPIGASGHPEDILNDTKYGDGLTDWDKIYSWDGYNQTWISYRKGRAENTLTYLDNTMGFWLRLTSNGGALTVGTGDYSSTNVDISLYLGWNLVSYPSATSRLASDTLPGVADLVAYYDAASPYLITEGLPGAVTFSEGNGYWVRVTADTTWSVAL